MTRGVRLTGLRVVLPFSIILILFALSINVASADGTTLVVETQIPEYILSDNLTLSGTYTEGNGTVMEDLDPDFNQGTMDNVTVNDGKLRFQQPITFDILNNGNAIVTNGGSSAWDSNLRFMSALKVGSTYYLFYTGGTGWDYAHVGLATSSDGITWTKHSSNPIFRCRSHSGDTDKSYANPYVYHDGISFYMFYSVWQGSGTGWEIHLATSNNGVSWSKHSSNPILDNSLNPNAWEYQLQTASIMKDGNTYRLYYYGHAQGGTFYLAMATSNDLKTWTEYANNPMRKGDTNGWEYWLTTYGTIEMIDGTYRIWSSSGANPGGKYYVGWIRSVDGVTFTPSVTAQLSPKANTIYAQGVRDPYLIDEGDHYLMIAVCYNSASTMTYGAFRVEKGLKFGEYTSRLYDMGSTVKITSIQWMKNLTEGGDVNLTFMWSNDSVHWSTWEEIGPSQPPVGITARYFRYSAQFLVEDYWSVPTLDSFSFDYMTSIDVIEVRVDEGPWQNIPFRNGVWNVTVDLQDGDYNITLLVWDITGIFQNVTIPVRVDLIPPVGSILLVSGRPVTDQKVVRYTLDVEDSHEVTHCKVSTRPDLSDTDWVKFTQEGFITQTGKDGPFTVFAIFQDVVGRTSDVYSDTVIVDTSVPEVSFVINDGDEYTNRSAVVLSVTWTDLSEIIRMRVGTNPDVGYTGVDQTPSDTLYFDMGQGDGERALYLWVQDQAGWSVIVWDTIFLDTTPPDGTLTVNHGLDYTNRTSLAVRFEVTDDLSGTDGIRMSEDPTFDGVGWSTFIDRTEWNLSHGDGVRSLYAEVRDRAGNVRMLTDSVVLDTVLPLGRLGVGGFDTVYSDHMSVTVWAEVEDEGSGTEVFWVYDDSEGIPVQLEVITPFFGWQFVGTDGQRWVFVVVVDRAGNQVVLSDDIIVDTMPPEGDISINEGSQFTNDTTVTIHLSVIDDTSGLAEMVISNDGPPLEDTADWIAFSEALAWDLSDGDGEKTVYVAVRDRAGLVIYLVATIVLDTTPPVVTFSRPSGRTTSESGIELSVTVIDDIDGSPTVMFRMNDGDWYPLQGSIFTLELVEGTNSVEVSAIDAAGNTAIEKLEVTYEPPFTLTSGWLILILVVVLVVMAAGYYLWSKRDEESME